MPTFSYKALSSTGQSVQDVAEANSKEQLRAELSNQGLHVQSVRQSSGNIILFRRKPRLEEIVLFNQEFVALINAGLPITEVLEIVSTRPGSPVLAGVLNRIRSDIRAGAQLSDAFASHPECFDSLYIASLQTGEKAGQLANSLSRHQQWLERRLALRKKINQALAYPLFIASVLVAIVLVLFIFVIPRFVSMYADLGAELPAATRTLLDLVSTFPIWGSIVAVLTAVLVASYRYLIRNQSGRRLRDQWLCRTPVVGWFVRTSTLVQLGGMLAPMLSAGTPIVNALKTAANAMSNRAHGQQLLQAAKTVSEGASLADALNNTDILTPSARKLIQAGESSGSLEKMLDQMAQYYDRELDYRISRMSSLIEPIVMLLMGVIIGVIIVVMYLPIFHLAGAIQ